MVVSGSPGAGKSTLAGPLASKLGFPLLSKDIIKETLFDQLGHVDDDKTVLHQLGFRGRAEGGFHDLPDRPAILRPLCPVANSL